MIVLISNGTFRKGSDDFSVCIYLRITVSAEVLPSHRAANIAANIITAVERSISDSHLHDKRHTGHIVRPRKSINEILNKLSQFFPTSSTTLLCLFFTQKILCTHFVYWRQFACDNMSELTGMVRMGMLEIVMVTIVDEFLKCKYYIRAEPRSH